jgi:hypothetical protein
VPAGRARLQLLGDAPVQELGDRRRHRGARRLEDQVVRERAVADDVGGLELAPRLGDVERVQLEHRRRQLGREARAGERGGAGELERRRRQLQEAPLDEGGDRRRLRQRGRRRPLRPTAPCP